MASNILWENADFKTTIPNHIFDDYTFDFSPDYFSPSILMNVGHSNSFWLPPACFTRLVKLIARKL